MIGGTVRCRHCKRWQGSARVLLRKKAHLQKCPEYAAWRAAGNGQELAPPNPYNAAGRRLLSESNNGHPDSTIQQLQSTVDISKYFDEFVDDSLGHECVRVRCQSCGFVRPKDATWQAEHLLGHCKDFLTTAEGEEPLANGALTISDEQYQNVALWMGARPSPDLLVSHGGPNDALLAMAPRGFSPPPSLPETPPRAEAPSLTKHLLAQADSSLTSSTQHAFLAHAGSGLLTESALNQWLTQIGYLSRSLVSFTGALIGKIRIPEVDNLEDDSTFRCLDLLCAAVSNMKQELEFLEATKRKYGLKVSLDDPTPPTKGFVDLFHSASCPSATLLEGMVMMWATEALFHRSFSYAARFVPRTAPISPPPNPHPLPSSLKPRAPADPTGVPPKPKDGHAAALREAFIENWKSDNFGRFVGACGAIVDELAITQGPTNGWEEMSPCERVFQQAVWLWGQIFPAVVDIEGLEPQVELENGPVARERRDHSAIDKTGPALGPVEVDEHQHAMTAAEFL
ncbi:hypothetical protein BDV25DRAFT_149026 [Aspergillus avenaceus]|uniref:Heme oxygenase-like protein n=1 Tax=Aspergillus avenaceus TaxID=36643 RepID=A0A5N6U5N2_ASPAV|nr:hypothetical protein BDV25DRAFT_149026 [Aspergillus avenaceus]